MLIDSLESYFFEKKGAFGAHTENKGEKRYNNNKEMNENRILVLNQKIQTRRCNVKPHYF